LNVYPKLSLIVFSMVLLKSFSHGIVQSVETSVWLFLLYIKTIIRTYVCKCNIVNVTIIFFFFTCTLNKNFKLCIPILILKRSKLYMVWTTWY